MVVPRHTVQFVGGKYIDYVAEVSYWKIRIKEIGGTAAYQELADSVAKLTNINQHVAAHTFGEALYEIEGLSGLPVCDDRFGQGCVHSFFSLAMQDYGITVGLPKLDSQCLEQTQASTKRTCEHGIGHGIQSYLGYTPSDLEHSLIVCTTLKDHSNLGLGCFGGAFMEYNLRNTLGSSNPVHIQPLTDQTVYQPCVQLSNNYQPACMFWQPFWWQTELKNTPAQAFYATMGAYCSGAGSLSADAVRACFEGIGYDAPILNNFNAADTADACASISDKAKDRIACWSWGFSQFGRGEGKANASRVCVGLESSEKEFCTEHNLDYVDLSKDILSL